MRHQMDGKKLSRTTSHRRALWRNMAAALIQHGAIRTTEVKAKQLRRFVEKLITTAKKNTLHARRQVIAKLRNRKLYDDEGQIAEQSLIQKLFEEVAPRYADRPGGYTRIIRLAERRIGDASKQVLLQLVEEETVKGGGGGSRRKKRAAMRQEAAAGGARAAARTEVAEADQTDEALAAEADAAAEAPEGRQRADEAADESAEPEHADDAAEAEAAEDQVDNGPDDAQKK